jgi:AcrR family transcriptional regulator
VPTEPRTIAGAPPRRLRADAVRNRERLLAAARDVIVEQGADAPLDEIARRAGVGIATLYRRFPDRPALQHEVARDLLSRSAHEASTALAAEPDAFAALARYLHRMLDLGISAVMPALIGQLRLDGELLAARRASSRAVEAFVAAAHADGSLRGDVTEGDVGLLLVRLARPLPGPFPPAANRQLAHRHLDLVLDGLRSQAAPSAPLTGPAMTFDDLAAMAAPAARDRRPPDPRTTERSTP